MCLVATTVSVRAGFWAFSLSHHDKEEDVITAVRVVLAATTTHMPAVVVDSSKAPSVISSSRPRLGLCVQGRRDITSGWEYLLLRAVVVFKRPHFLRGAEVAPSYLAGRGGVRLPDSAGAELLPGTYNFTFLAGLLTMVIAGNRGCVRFCSFYCVYTVLTGWSVTCAHDYLLY